MRSRSRNSATRPASEIVDVPYRGITQAGIAVVAGEIQASFVFQGAAKPLVMEGKARGLASTAGRRDPNWADLPTMAESGFPKFVHQGFVGLVAPAKTPPDVVALLNKHVNEIVRSETFRARFAPSGMHPVENNSARRFRRLRPPRDRAAQGAVGVVARFRGAPISAPGMTACYSAATVARRA